MLQVKSFGFNPFQENTYIVYNDNKNAFIIDPGNISEHETAALKNFIDDNGLTVKNILLTHAHIDHVLGLQWVHDTYKVPVLMHLHEKELLDRNPMTARNYGFFFKPFEGEIRHISESDTLSLDDQQLELRFVPGHSPGSLAFYSKDSGFVIAGDALFEGSIGRTDLYKGDMAQLLSSIRTQLFTLPDETKVYSGHGNPTTVGFEKQYNPFLKD